MKNDGRPGWYAHWAMAVGLGLAVVGTCVALLAPPQVREASDEELRATLMETLRRDAGGDRLERAVTLALDTGDLDAAADLFNLADALSVPVDPALRVRWRDETTGLAATKRALDKAWRGAIDRRADDPAGVAGVVVSYAVGLGDVLDLTEEAGKLLRGEAVDALTIGLSVAGLAATAGGVATMGGALPARSGLSLAKVARVPGLLTPAFRAELARMASRAVDLPQFRKTIAGVRWYRPDELAAATRLYAARVDAGELRAVAASVQAIEAASSRRAALAVLRTVDGAQDLRKAERAARVLGPATGGAFRLLGKGIFSAFVVAVTLTMQVLWAIAMAAFGILMAIAGALARSAARRWMNNAPKAKRPFRGGRGISSTAQDPAIRP
ncbi:MAG TPA: hypothetical protein VD978_06415 [Azospirillum sp.]|nr:hypothetical protein [Azospirillum sp.]